MNHSLRVTATGANGAVPAWQPPESEFRNLPGRIAARIGVESQLPLLVPGDQEGASRSEARRLHAWSGMTLPARPAIPAATVSEPIGFSLPLERGPLVLLLDPDTEANAQLVEALRGSGYRVREAVTDTELLGELNPALGSLDRPAMVLISVSGSNPGVLDILGAIEQSSGLPPCVALIPKDEDQLRDRAFENGVTAVVEKPYAPQTVLAIVAEEVPAERIVAC